MGHYASEIECDDYQEIEDLKKKGWSLFPIFLNPTFLIRNEYGLKEIRSNFYISSENRLRLARDIKTWLNI